MKKVENHWRTSWNFEGRKGLERVNKNAFLSFFRQMNSQRTY